MRIARILAATCLVLFACKKTSSKAFHEAQSKYEIATAQHGEDAYLSGELIPIVETLSAVESGALEYAQAQALVKKIAAETARLKAERAQAEKAVADVKTPSISAFVPGSGSASASAERDDVPAEAVDAGTLADTGPSGNMSTEAFLSRYRSCVKSVNAEAAGKEKKAIYEVIDTTECKKKLRVASEGTTQFEFVDNQLMTRTLQQTKTVTRVIDAGVTTTTRTQTGVYLPGMPAPGETEAPAPAP
jgi:hypothetical protein